MQHSQKELLGISKVPQIDINNYKQNKLVLEDRYLIDVVTSMELSVIFAVFIGALGLFMYWLLVARKKKSTKKDLILVVGPCGGGKTVLTYRLQLDKVLPTVTSMKPHTVQVRSDSKSGAVATVVDFPGHPRLKSQLALEYLHRAKKVIFVVDSVGNAAKIRDAAEQLYDMFIHPAFENNGPRLLVACNKCDVVGALPSLRIKLRLQEEIEKIRKTRQSLAESNETGSRLVLGREGQPFNMDKDAPVEVFFESISAEAGTKLEEVKKFIDSV